MWDIQAWMKKRRVLETDPKTAWGCQGLLGRCEKNKILAGALACNEIPNTVLLACDPGCQLRSWLQPRAAILGDPGLLISLICLTASPATLQPNRLQSLK